MDPTLVLPGPIWVPSRLGYACADQVGGFGPVPSARAACPVGATPWCAEDLLYISLHVICGELLNAVNCPSGELLEAVNCIPLFLQLKTASGSPVRPYPFWLKRFGQLTGNVEPSFQHKISGDVQ